MYEKFKTYLIPFNIFLSPYGGQMCLPCRISETAGRIALKFGRWLGSHQLGVLPKSLMGYDCTCARAHGIPLFYISGATGRIVLKFGVVRDLLV